MRLRPPYRQVSPPRSRQDREHRYRPGQDPFLRLRLHHHVHLRRGRGEQERSCLQPSHGPPGAPRFRRRLRESPSPFIPPPSRASTSSPIFPSPSYIRPSFPITCTQMTELQRRAMHECGWGGHPAGSAESLAACSEYGGAAHGKIPFIVLVDIRLTLG